MGKYFKRMLSEKMTREYIGVIRNIDSIGRVVLPKEFLNYLGLQAGGSVEMLLTKDEIIIKKTNDEKEKENE